MQYRTTYQLLMLLLHTDIVTYQHLHIPAIMSLLLQSPQHLWLAPLHLLHLYLHLLHLYLHLLLYSLRVDLGLTDLLQRLTMLTHLTQHSGLIEICGDDVILLLLLAISQQLLLNINCKTYCLQGHHVMSLFLEYTGQIIKGKYFKFAESMAITHIFRYLWQHDHIHCL
jgi:hypothetical protein